MPETRDPRRAEVTKARLLEAAVEAFAARGYHGTTTRDIASTAGMSPAAVYVHHSSKEELLYQISRSGHEDVLALLRAAVDSSEDPVEQLRVAVRNFAEHHVRAHTSARIVNYELAALSEPHLAEMLRIRHEIDVLFSDLVERGIASGAFVTPHPRMAVVALQSLGIDIARWYREPGWDASEIADGYVEIALRIVGASAA
ncbi:TetR/AcrR family transcriptional regulator [Nocardioides marmoriginsengisoli]|uniref:TetR/AcrR family transcriptional regulator n=1 Tax=Nocardioides marmoriginsengisoli TaxID=661483 RepID=A0A3N0CHH7_9ACTN|nr:TetR/AcrR family transcriptional regulator [Nocardioides marmoriginsengisoli]RNL62476.1 TetR/AcrR family transcriptional regulator [Nocardioides marmoriginsengisoli]